MKDVLEQFRYSPGVKAGPFLFMAGQLGRDEHLNVIEGKEAQFVQAFENDVMKERGLRSSWVAPMIGGCS